MQKSFTLLSLVCFAFFVAFSLQPSNAHAQKNKKSPASAVKAKNNRASDAKKDQKSAKDKSQQKTEKNTAKSRAEEKKNDRRAAKNEARKSADKSNKNRKDNDRAEKRDERADRKDKRRMTRAEREEARQAAAERKRQAAIEAAERRAREEAERRRRAEIERRRREAIARARAFENGLRLETQANILSDDTTGEDLTVRRAAINALGARAGSVVVMDAQNGQIVTVVNQKWALGQGYKPCSTIKLLTGIAGKNERAINDFGNVSYKSHSLDLTDALAVSNNGYFQTVGGAVGFPKMMQHARELGLGQSTGINTPGESAGKIPDYKTGYAVNHMSSHGDDFEVTPIQLATMVSAITNGGKLLQPQIARTKQEADALRPKVRRTLNIGRETLQSVVPGMVGAVNYGTARRANDPTLSIGGKTGSCIGQGSWLGLFASVAPIASPKYAVVVVTRGQAERGKWASAVAGQVYQALAPKIRALQPLLANQAPPVVPSPKIDVNAATTLSDEETDDSTEAAEILNNTQNAPTTLSDEKRQLVKPTVSIRPVGQPNNVGGTTTPAKARESATNPRVLSVPTGKTTAVPQPTPTIKSRPRVVP